MRFIKIPPLIFLLFFISGCFTTTRQGTGKSSVYRASVKTSRPREAIRKKTEKEVKGHDALRIEKGRFIWPVKGEIIAKFGTQNDVTHNGIDIKAPRGALIKAADDGEVAYSINGMRGYGNVVILKHKGDFFTVYAQNDKNLVKTGEKVVKGSTIALVGDSGNENPTPSLHFEIRQGKKTVNPLFFLP